MLLAIAIISLAIIILEIVLQATLPTYFGDSPLLTLAILAISIIAWWSTSVIVVIILIVLWVLLLIFYMR